MGAPFTGFLLALAAASAVSGAWYASGDLCNGTRQWDAEHNDWCRRVDQVAFTNMAPPAPARDYTYQDVVGLDIHAPGDLKKCRRRAKTVSGVMGPFGEPLSVHMRGPIVLKQFAFYELVNVTAGHKTSDARARDDAGGEDHHQRRQAEGSQGVLGTAAAAGGPPSTALVVVPVTAAGTSVTGLSPSQRYTSSAPATTLAGPTPSSASTTVPLPTTLAPDQLPFGNTSIKDDPSGVYVRRAYYHSESGNATNVTFLANIFNLPSPGGPVPVIGQQYANRSGTGASYTPQILDDVLLKSRTELTIMSNTTCDGTCGWVTNTTRAYRGFGGANKVFLFEFLMPHDGGGGGDASDPGGGRANATAATLRQADLPALWLLNARIPQTAQYGCNCFPACGEFDVYEALAAGGERAASSFRGAGAYGGRDANWFPRPLGAPAKVAVVFDARYRAVFVATLDPGFGFGEALLGGDVEGIMRGAGRDVVSLWRMDDGVRP